MIFATARVAIAGGLVLILVACGQKPPAPVSMPYAEPGVSFSVTQTSSECSDEGNYRASVAWQVPETQPEKLEIQIDAFKRKVFARSDLRSGSEETGVWVSAGLAFYLLDRESDRVIAATEAAPANCSSAPTN